MHIFKLHGSMVFALPNGRAILKANYKNEFYYGKLTPQCQFDFLAVEGLSASDLKEYAALTTQAFDALENPAFNHNKLLELSPN